MTTNVYLNSCSVYGGVYNGENYTLFLTGGGLCVLPRKLVENHTEGQTPEARISYIVLKGLNSSTDEIAKRSTKAEESINNSFLNLRNHE